ncbi:putative phosphohydrolase [Elusimicrobium minutum Pei191]|uniref:Putative phosphohydrolase n=1 Tax=Elusimicrobium minutum (strain Pei191) TaxID=445932 RepID=B2KBQ3_ELUMP|nr:metallophosphoesterase [Elusimicrobium minutum]ACC97740.1 putative phosphohydrolase [Elusimicrobium minutum Pei191]
MKKLLVFILLNISAFGFGAEFTRGPYVEDPTLTTAIIKWHTDVPSVGWFEYGPSPKCNQIMTISPKSTSHEVVLHGLVANKEFCYKAYIQNNAEDGVQEPRTGKFKTLYSPERKVVKFVIFGNTAGSGELLPALVEKLKKHNPDFYIHTGDLVSTGSALDADKEFFTPFKDVLAKAPMFIAVGDKEYGPDLKDKESRGFFRTNYSRVHTMSWGKGTPNYYYFDTANARFIFLDTSSAAGALFAPGITKDSAQYDWLRTALATTEAGKWKVVVMHLPAYSSGAKGSNEDVKNAFTNLFEYYGVNVVFQGDERSYERTFPIREGVESLKGIVYQTFGTGASAELTKREFKEPWTARFLSGQVYGVGEIVDRKLTVNVYNLDGTLVDTLELYQSL